MKLEVESTWADPDRVRDYFVQFQYHLFSDFWQITFVQLYTIIVYSPVVSHSEYCVSIISYRKFYMCRGRVTSYRKNSRNSVSILTFSHFVTKCERNFDTNCTVYYIAKMR